jgi:membrane protein YfhO
MKRSWWWIYLALLANVVVFFYKPLFSSEYIFPWDFRTVQLPQISFLAEELHSGRFALWSPFSYCGFPIFANIEACFFHPLVLASAFISAHTSLDALPKLLEWIVVLQVWFAGISAYWLFRELGANAAPAFAGGVIFETGGFFASRAEHIGAMMAVAWMPLAWLAILKLRHAFRSEWLAILGAALGMSILGGFPQPTLAVFASTAVLALFVAALKIGRPRVIVYAGCGCALGIALASIQFIPTTQLTEWSVAKYRADWLGTGGGLHWQTLVSLVLPNHYNIFDLTRFNGPWDPTFLYQYVSLLGLLLAIFAVLAARRRSVALLAAMAGFSLLWMIGDQEPVWNWIYPLLPEKVRIGIHPEYTYCIFTLALAGLTAMGLESLRIRQTWKWAAGAVIAADLFLVGAGRPMNCMSLKQEPGVTRTSFDGSADLLETVRRTVNREYPPVRIDNTPDTSQQWAFQAPLTRIPTANGVTPLAPASIIQLRLSLHDGSRWGWYYPVAKIDSPVLDLMGVRYLIAGAQFAPQLRASPRFRHVASLPGNELFENTTALPRFFLVDSLSSSALAVHRTAGEIRLVDYEPAALELSIRAPATSVLVMSETYYPGWKAWLDGKPAEIRPAYIAFRSVAIPSGNHQLRMEFHPGILVISIAISVATAVLLAVLGIRGARRKSSSAVR